MAKTIMIANDVYEELKNIKMNRSFSELIREMVTSKDSKKGSGLKECIGIIKEDKEWKKNKKELDKEWKKWTKKYV